MCVESLAMVDKAWELYQSLVIHRLYPGLHSLILPNHLEHQESTAAGSSHNRSTQRHWYMVLIWTKPAKLKAPRQSYNKSNT